MNNGTMTYIKMAKKNKNPKLLISVLTFVIIGIAITFFVVLSDVNGLTGSKEDITIAIPSGSSALDIANLLKDKGIIDYPQVFVFLSKQEKAGEGFKMGDHTVNSHMSYYEIMKVISEDAQSSLNIKVTIPEGFETYRIADALADKGLADKERFLKKLDEADFGFRFIDNISRRSNRLEGYLFPATYTFQPDVTEDEIIGIMLDKFNQEFNLDMSEKAKKINMSVDQVVTLASIIEREAKNAEEMPIISSIFHNRLKKGSKYPYLQSCATIQYLLKERKAILSIEDTQINSPYNTYKNKGLPPGPIANPGKAAIMAALEPAETEYFFFVVGRDGNHIYSKTYAEHEKAVRENQ